MSIFRRLHEYSGRTGGFGFGAGDKYALVHLDFDDARPLLGFDACLEGPGLQGLALFCLEGYRYVAEHRDVRERPPVPAIDRDRVF